MATVIDSLLVSLGMDSSSFTKGQKDAEASIRKLSKEEQKAQKEREQASKQQKDSIVGVKNELLGLAAAYVGFGAIKSFIADTVLQTAALGRTSEAFGLSAHKLAEWQLAAKHAGGSAEEITGIIKSASDSLADMTLGYGMSEQFKTMARIAGGSGVSLNFAALHNETDVLLKQADIIKGIKDRSGDNVARDAAEKMGIGIKEYQLFSGGGSELQKKLDANSDLATQQEGLSKNTEELRQKFDTLSNKLLELANKALPSVISGFDKLADYLLSPEFAKATDTLVSGITKVAGMFEWLGKAIGNAFGWLHVRSEENKKSGIGKWFSDWEKKNFPGLFADKEDTTSETPKTTSKLTPASQTTAQSIMGQLVSAGFTREQAAGITGSLAQESQLSATASNKAGAYGLAQWTKDRKDDFFRWSGHKLQDSDLQEQTNFMIYELTKGTEKPAGDKIKKTKTAAEAAVAARKYYERPGEDEARDDKRIAYANQFLSSGQQNNAIGVSNSVNTPKSPVSNNNTSHTNTTDVTINNLNVHTQATDSNGIAASIGPAIQRTTQFGLANANTAIAG